MKKINKLINKQETFIIIYVIAILVYIVGAISENELISGCVNVLLLPILLLCFTNVISKQVENHSFDVELYMLPDVPKGEMVWSNYNNGKEISYFKIINIGKIDIFEVFIKVETHHGKNVYYKIMDNFFPNESCFVKIPYSIVDIEKVTISCSLRTESRTKEFYGKHSTYDSQTIFSIVRNKEREKDSIIHEIDVKEFVQLERLFEV